MDRTIQQEQARHAFEKSLKSGRRDTGFFSRLAGRDNRLLLLSQVREAVTGGEESYHGVQEIEVRKIVGTQNRGDEFSRDFHPLKTWMSKRWVTIYDLLWQNALHDPIQVTEIGGCYFVRDGHHRVSAARALSIEFLPAEVTSEPLPYRLPGGMDRNLLPLLRSKDRFHRRTNVFDVISDGEFYVACPSTWQWLEREICEYNRAWFVRRYDREPDSRAEQVEIWYVNLYRNAIEYIRRNSLAYLFPQKRETDIFVEMIRLWNSFDHPDRIWLGEIYRLFIARQRRKRLFRTPLQYGASAVQSLLMSAEEEYRRFTRISQIEELVTDFQPLPKSKGLYRFLYRQLIHHYAPALKREYGRAPYIQELTPRWHREFYAPVAAHARLQGGEVDQSRFYIAFSRRYLRSFLAGSISLEEALQRYGRATRIRG
jgi:hypothetical protein